MPDRVDCIIVNRHQISGLQANKIIKNKALCEVCITSEHHTHKHTRIRLDSVI